MFWIQLPLLVLAMAVIIVATTALWRARPEDVPRVHSLRGVPGGRTRSLADPEPNVVAHLRFSREEPMHALDNGVTAEAITPPAPTAATAATRTLTP